MKGFVKSKLLASICYFLAFVSVYKAHAQLENVWVFGNLAGIDFNSGIPTLYSSAILGGERTASICDEKGQLLFYTSGDQVWTRDHQLMPHGDTLITDPTLPFNRRGVYCRSTSNASLIIPIPGQTGKYYLFSLTETEMQQWAGRLYYSIIDMSLNNGMGDVDINHKSILLDSNLTEHLSAAAGDRCNIWLICIPNPNMVSGSRFKSFEITENGISRTPVVSSVPGIFSAGLQFGKIDIAPNRRKVAVCRSDGFRRLGYAVELYDFNPVTGLLSNQLLFSRQSTAGRECYYGVSFSPDGSKIYASGASSGSGSEMFQFDISKGTVDDIINSRTLIDNAFDVKCAPDGKVYYLQQRLTTATIGVIHNPNQAGMACQPEPDVLIAAPGASFSGFPNVVPFIRSDTLLTTNSVSTPCFADGRYHKIKAADDSTGWGYIWNNGISEAVTTTDTPGIYWVTYRTSPCTYRTDTFHVQFANGVLPGIVVDASCFNTANGAVTLSTYPGDTVQYRYTWTDAEGNILSHADTLKQVSAGKYSLHIATERCDTTLSVDIPSAHYRVSFRSDSIVCQGKEFLFQNTSDAHFTSFQWDFGNETYAALASPAHSYSVAGIYRVSLTGSGAICKDTFYRYIVVDSLLNGAFHVPSDKICVGESINFYPTNDSSMTRLEWFFGDGLTYRGPIEKHIHHAYDHSGKFPVLLTTYFRACPESYYTDTVTVFPVPVLNLGSDADICLAAAPVQLQVTQDSEGYIYRWNTGDTTPSIWVRHPGTYSLSIENGYGCTATDEITVQKDCYIDIPNAFTPNGDGYNDYFFPRQKLGRALTSIRLEVWDRWGQIVFESRELNGRGWDGSFRSEEQPAGVYLYKIEVEVNNRWEVYTGNVTLLR